MNRVRCVDCAHDPGRGRHCPRGNVAGGTAHWRRCDHFEALPTPQCGDCWHRSPTSVCYPQSNARHRLVRVEADADDIDIIHGLLNKGSKKQNELIALCKDEGLSRRRVLTLLKRYARGDGAIWVCRRGNEKNAAVYSLRTEPGYLRK